MVVLWKIIRGRDPKSILVITAFQRCRLKSDQCVDKNAEKCFSKTSFGQTLHFMEGRIVGRLVMAKQVILIFSPAKKEPLIKR